MREAIDWAIGIEGELHDWFMTNSLAGAVIIVLFAVATVASTIAFDAQTTQAVVKLSGMLDGATIECVVVKGDNDE